MANSSRTNLSWLDGQEQMLCDWLAEALREPNVDQQRVERLRAHLQWLKSERNNLRPHLSAFA